MIDGLKPYPEYKDSGSRFIGVIPRHWDQRCLWTVSKLRTDRNPGDLPLLSVFLDRGVIPYSEGSGQVHAPSLDLSNYQIVCPGDFVLNNQQAWRGSVGVSRYHGIISPAYIVLGLSERLDSAFANYLMRCPRMIDQFVVASKGVGDIQRQIYWSFLRTVQVPIPNSDDQIAIVQFLDHANVRIDRIMRAKKKLIALLNEQKDAIIHRAVTRGLDPTVPLKPSGIPWLGDIPKHWQILRAKYLFREVDERSTNGSEELLSVSHITGVTPRSQKNITMFKARSYIGHKLCCPGDLVVNTMWAWMAALGVSAYAGIISPAYAVYRPRHAEQFVGHYIDVLLRTKPYVSNIICHSTGVRASRLRLYPEEFFRLPIILPPVREQSRIVENIAAETAHLEASTIHAEREIALLREYRIRLSADVVTGKLDVREAARDLPDTAEEAGAREEIEELTDVEPEDAEPEDVEA